MRIWSFARQRSPSRPSHGACSHAACTTRCHTLKILSSSLLSLYLSFLVQCALHVLFVGSHSFYSIHFLKYLFFFFFLSTYSVPAAPQGQYHPENHAWMDAEEKVRPCPKRCGGAAVRLQARTRQETVETAEDRSPVSRTLQESQRRNGE